MKRLKILVACEFSGIVRDAFIKAGHLATSCDLLPTERPGPHYQCDVFKIIDEGWDMMIAFPPYTHLAVSGARYFKQKHEDGRQQEGIDFFLKLATAKIPRIAIENPIGIMSRLYRKPSQIIQPWMFGHSESKATCLWLKGLPVLEPTKIMKKKGEVWDNQTPSGQNKLGPSAERAKLRSTTYQGIADAMASQWSAFLEGEES